MHEALQEAAEARASMELALEQANKQAGFSRKQARVSWQNIDVLSPEFVQFRRKLSQLLSKGGPLGTLDNPVALTEDEAWCVCGEIEEMARKYAAQMHTDAVDLVLKGICF